MPDEIKKLEAAIARYHACLDGPGSLAVLMCEFHKFYCYTAAPWLVEHSKDKEES